MSSIFTISILQSALELGFIYSLVVLALFLSFSILNIADLSTDGCFTLGCAVAASMTLAGHPVLALFCAIGAGVLSGFVTAFLQTRMGVESILAGIIVNTGLYTVNIAVMGFSSNLNLFQCDSIFTMTKDFIEKHCSAGVYQFLVTDGWYRLILVAIIVIAIGILLGAFMSTRLGLSIRATGDNTAMVKASSINPKYTITVGLCVSSALTALSGGILAQYQKSCDINLGTGMVTIALASLIIGETLVGKKTMVRRIVGVIFGSCLYRFIVAVAIRVNVPAECLKLVSALIVAIAIAFPYLKNKAVFAKHRYANIAQRKKGGAC
ncbi:MAG: ABC transporter permease [Butyribacter sp.]|nr:ABC transporter permease [bacterium]MDY3854844.1 ABC transporter permease [Butyribacter sp.]